MMNSLPPSPTRRISNQENLFQNNVNLPDNQVNLIRIFNQTNVIESTRKRTKHCFGNSGANVFFSLGMEFVVQSAWCRLPLP